MSKKIVIVGGGIAGLSAGIYAQNSGFDVTIAERHSIPGGMCTSWKRKGYLFEGAIHWLSGSNPSTPLNRLWQEVGALDANTEIMYHDPFFAYEHEGKTLYLYRDLTKLYNQLLEVSREDEGAISALVKDIKAISKVGMPIYDVKGVKTDCPTKMGARAVLNMMRAMPTMMRLNKISVKDYLNNFKHQGIRGILNVVPEEYGATALLFTLATLINNDGGYPKGGSLALTKRMADKFEGMGGKLLLNTKVQKVEVKDGSVLGVIINGELLEADSVIITQESIAAFNNLFDIPLKDEWVEKMRKTDKPSLNCFIGLGIKADVEEFPAFALKTPLDCGGIKHTYFAFNNYSQIKEYAPPNCTALTMAFLGDSYDFWKTAKENGTYKEEKQKVIDEVCNILVEKHPNFKDKIEVADLATPLTYERYTGANKGSWMQITLPNQSPPASYLCKLANAKGVFFAGQRTLPPGGLPAALISGRNAVQMACISHNTTFITPKIK